MLLLVVCFESFSRPTLVKSGWVRPVSLFIGEDLSFKAPPHRPDSLFRSHILRIGLALSPLYPLRRSTVLIFDDPSIDASRLSVCLTFVILPEQKTGEPVAVIFDE